MLTPARDVAFKILLRVEQRHSYAVELLNSRLAEKLSAADRALAQEIVMGCLRWQGQLDWLAAHFSGKLPVRLDLEVRLALRIGIYQSRFLERIPAAAAVDQSVALVKRAGKASAAGLVNAVLRKVTRAPLESLFPAGLSEAEKLLAEFSHPPWLLERWARRYGWNRARSIARVNNQPPPTFLRVPPGASVEDGQPCRYVRSCRELTDAAPQLARRFPVQDEASQIIPYLLAPEADERVLDLCAGPGVKTGALAEMAPGAMLVAADLHPARLRLMKRLAAPGRAGTPLCVALDGTRPLPFAVSFQRILVDAPCSGTGTIRRNPEIKWRLTENDLTTLVAKQRWLLNCALECLAPGGRLVYSTCSIEPEENQAVVEEVLEDRPDCVLVPMERSVARPAAFLTDAGQELLRGRYLETLPDQGLDGFFAAAIERR